MSEAGFVCIGQVAECFSGYPFESKEFCPPGEGEARVFRGDNLKEGCSEWGAKEKRWKAISPELEKYQLKQNDVLVGMDGSKVGKNWTRVDKGDLPALLGQRVCRIRAGEFADQDFIFHVFGSYDFKSYVECVKTGTSIPHISNNQIRDFGVFLPPLPEQKKIAEILSRIYSTAEKLKGEKAKYQALLVSMRQRIFDDEGAVIHRFDEIVSERVLGTTRRGTGARESIPLVKMGDIMRGNIKIGDNERIEYDKDLDDLLLRKGDILFNTRNTPALVGKTAIHDSGPRCTFDNNLMRIRVVADVDSWYLNHLMNSPQFLQSLSRITAGTTSVAAIYWNDLRRLKVPLPSIGRQRQIVKSIASIHSAINNLAAKICCLEELEFATSCDLLSGRKRVSI